MNIFVKWLIVFPILGSISASIIFLILYALDVIEWIHIIPIAAVLGFIDSFSYLKLSGK